MTVELITGHAGAAHVSSTDAGWFNAGTVGSGKYVLDTGTQFAAEVQSANVVQIGVGDAIFEGRHVRVSATENVAIDNGAQGVNRNDLICIKYEYDSGTDIESASLEVIKGSAVSGTPSDPTIPSGSILNGASTAYMALWRIPIEGITVGTPVKMYGDVLATLRDVGIGSVAASRLTGTIASARIPDLGGTYLKRKPSGSGELPQNSTSTAYPLALSNTFANNGQISYMTPANFRTAIGVGTIGTKNTLAASDIPSIPASKITSGTLPAARGGTGKTYGFAWQQLTTGTNKTLSYSLSGYSEVMVVCQHGTDLLASTVLPVAALTTTAKEVYLGGGYNGAGTNGRSAVIRMTTTKAVPQIVMVNATDVVSSASWQIYAR